jgi:hypothetical protein
MISGMKSSLWKRLWELRKELGELAFGIFCIPIVASTLIRLTWFIESYHIAVVNQVARVGIIAVCIVSLPLLIHHCFDEAQILLKKLRSSNSSKVDQ